MSKILTFYLGEKLLGIDITRVKEINRNIEFTPVPGSAASIVGLFNMRGQVVTLFDLEKLLSIAEIRPPRRTMVMVLKPLERQGDLLGLMIDRAGDVVEIAEDQVQPPPANLMAISADRLTGVVKMDADLIMVINPERLLQ